MPITDVGSYGPTGHAFEAHWADVNADRVANTLPELTLPDGYAVTNLSSDVAAVETSIIETIDLENGLTQATNSRDTLRTTLRERLMEFRDLVEYRFPGSGYAQSLPQTPDQGARQQKLLKALHDMQSIWTRIDADSGLPNFTPPLVLREGMTLATFSTDLTTMRANFVAVDDADNDLRIARNNRDVLLNPLRSRFVKYREGVRLAFGDEHPLTTALPDVYSTPGSTPDAVTLSGEWDEPAMEAALTWTASSNPNLNEYEIRVSPGATYDAGSSSIAGPIPAGGEELRTTQGLDMPGDTASFKVFVVLTTGNRAGSNPVTITRP